MDKVVIQLDVPIIDFGNEVHELTFSGTRLGAYIRAAGRLGDNVDAKNAYYIEKLGNLSAGAAEKLSGDDWDAAVKAIEPLVEGPGAAVFEKGVRFPIVLKHPVVREEGPTIVEILEPTRRRTGADMVAAGEEGHGNDDGRLLVFLERLCTARTAAGERVELTREIVDLMNGWDLDLSLVALVPFLTTTGRRAGKGSSSASPADTAGAKTTSGV